tara:strand:- start:194 stop:595 length:402 start_codon:yes stop_codon:yes gene_type:complete
MTVMKRKSAYQYALTAIWKLTKTASAAAQKKLVTAKKLASVTNASTNGKEGIRACVCNTVSMEISMALPLVTALQEWRIEAQAAMTAWSAGTNGMRRKKAMCVWESVQTVCTKVLISACAQEVRFLTKRVEIA